MLITPTWTSDRNASRSLRVKISASRTGSMLPPDRTMPTREPLGMGSLPARTAAAGTAPVGSTRILQRSSRKRTASSISLSETSSTSARFRMLIGKVSTPGERLRMPSAMVGGGAMVTRSPFLNER